MRLNTRGSASKRHLEERGVQLIQHRYPLQFPSLWSTSVNINEVVRYDRRQLIIAPPLSRHISLSTQIPRKSSAMFGPRPQPIQTELVRVHGTSVKCQQSIRGCTSGLSLGSKVLAGFDQLSQG
ncbi:hypothetical protein PCH_Pc06g00870 [Penicillium rubens Wisconsin 54-1255]|uniref:Uncharacterized protein n=1 Tax=Penicillium rubens (strain ATCC 28089 / DSM 1075 / NRRL 1951 / Wisconsin 54-1255) TaxID=500485 RepID=B6GW26_PENRW|nr:hypothetical protein PCH_Pc06g00870 [Penicillium rubens Wisconsin 54-1255]